MQVGALRDIKRDMALRRNSLHKQLVHELEDRVFVSVGTPKGTSGNPDDPEGDEDDSRSLSNSLIRSTARLLRVIFRSFLDGSASCDSSGIEVNRTHHIS